MADEQKTDNTHAPPVDDAAARLYHLRAVRHWRFTAWLLLPDNSRAWPRSARAGAASGGPVWFLMASDEGHGFAKKKNQDFLFYATVAFIQAHLLN